MPNFPQDGSLAKLQDVINQIYGVPDDRLFSVSDLLSNQERFTMRTLKGIRKGDSKRLKVNLLVATSWLMAIAGRFHISLEEVVWERFPNICSYCGRKPCCCKKIKPAKRAKLVRQKFIKPVTLSELQKMFAEIYPPSNRTLFEAGVHLAEEVGEMSEAIHHFMGEHKKRIFGEIRDEIADYVSCVMGVANSAGFDVAKELSKMYSNNCHVCHKAPCECSFSYVAKFKV